MSRKELIRIFTFLGGIYFFLEFVLPPTVAGYKVDAYHEQISNGFVLVGTMALGLGLINLVSLHGSRIIFLRKQWINSVALLAGLVLMMVVTTMDWLAAENNSGRVQEIFLLRDFSNTIKSDYEARKEGVPDYASRNRALQRSGVALVEKLRGEVGGIAGVDPGSPDAILMDNYRNDFGSKLESLNNSLTGLTMSTTPTPEELNRNVEVAASFNAVALVWQDLLNLSYKYDPTHRMYTLLYDGLFVALGSAMFSLLGFYMAAAAYRAFRVKSAESALMMAAALFVMLGQIPFGIYLWEGFTEVRLWLLTTPSSAAFRAIKIGAEVAGLVIAFRMWFSIESDSFESK